MVLLCFISVLETWSCLWYLDFTLQPKDRIEIFGSTKKKKNYLLQHIQIRKVWCSSLISVTWLFWQRNPRHWMAISLVISDLRKCIQEIFILPSNFHVRGCEVGWSPLLRTSPSSNYLPRSRLFLSKIKSLQKIPRENKWDSYENAWVQSK